MEKYNDTEFNDDRDLFDHMCDVVEANNNHDAENICNGDNDQITKNNNDDASLSNNKPSDTVKSMYAICQARTQSLGNGCHGPIYGELSMNQMHRIINAMKQHACLNKTSKFIDVGSGTGKPNLHVAQDPGVAVSFGIECEISRWMLGMSALDELLKKKNDNINCKCIFAHANILNANTFDPFTHVYMFSIGYVHLH